MKTSASAFPFLLALSTGSLLAAAEVQSGASLETMRANLGVPRGQLQVGARQVIYYEQGEVELQNGILARVTLRSPEERAILVAREERLQGEREARRAQLLAEGTALRAQKLADASFQAAPFAYQVAFWEDFARRYPEVPCVEPLTIARVRLNEQKAEKRQRDEQARRLAEVEEQLAVAQQRWVRYPVRSYSRYSGRHHYRSAGLGPFTYTFFDSPLPPYSTPSGNPAGDLSVFVVKQPANHPASPGRHEGKDRRDNRWQRGDHADGHQEGRDREGSSRRLSERM